MSNSNEVQFLRQQAQLLQQHVQAHAEAGHRQATSLLLPEAGQMLAQQQETPAQQQERFQHTMMKRVKEMEAKVEALRQENQQQQAHPSVSSHRAFWRAEIVQVKLLNLVPPSR